MTDGKRVCIAHVAGASGIKGELVLKCYAEDPLDLKRYGELSDEAGARAFRVLSVRIAGKGVIARLGGIDDRNTAEAMKGTALFVARERLSPPGDGAYYRSDLVGLAAVLLDGRPLGRISDVANYGAGDLLEIACPDGRKVLIPFADGFVGKVDLAGGTVAIEEVEGLTGETSGDASTGRDDD